MIEKENYSRSQLTTNCSQLIKKQQSNRDGLSRFEKINCPKKSDN